MAVITTAGEHLIAEKLAARQTLLIERFIIAQVPDLDIGAPVDRNATRPTDEQIVHTAKITQAGFVNPNQVVYSVMLGSEVGDFDWNWIGLESNEGVLISVAYVPLQQKRKHIPPHQVGNNVTRNFMLLFDGAQALTEVNIDASTWQHDFTLRLRGIDAREQRANADLFGDAVFYRDGFGLESSDTGLELLPGLAYVNGIRLQALKPLQVNPPTYPTTLWLDVSLWPELNDVVAHWVPLWGADVDATHMDSAGIRHDRIRIADLPDASTIEDRRRVLPADSALIDYLAARVGDYPQLRARATTKADVGLSELPNAKSDDPESNSSEILATTAALATLHTNISDGLVGMVAPFAMNATPPGWLKCNGTQVSRTKFAKLFAAIGTAYGAGDGASTFNLPDLRGRFVRGWNDGAALDSGRAIGSVQDWQNGSHIHGASAAAAGHHEHVAGSHVAGAHTHPAGTHPAGQHGHIAHTGVAGEHSHPLSRQIFLAAGGNLATPLEFGSRGRNADNLEISINNAGNHAHAVGVQPSGEHSHGVVVHGSGEHAHKIDVQGAGQHGHNISIASSGGTESRPTNTALLYCIKF